MNPFIRAADALTTKVHSFSDLIDWFMWIPFYMKLMVGFGIVGLVALLYIFIVAIFVDKHY